MDEVRKIVESGIFYWTNTGFYDRIISADSKIII